MSSHGFSTTAFNLAVIAIFLAISGFSSLKQLGWSSAEPKDQEIPREVTAVVRDPAADIDFDRTTQFIQLLTSHQPQIYAFIASVVPCDSAAFDVLQDTNLYLWEKADRYEFGRPFLPWACGCARHRMMEFYRKRKRSRLVFCDQTVNTVSDQRVTEPDTGDDRFEALQKCLRKLSPEQAELIHERYMARTPVHTIASRLNESAHNISSRLYRIRKTLANCVECAMATENRS